MNPKLRLKTAHTASLALTATLMLLPSVTKAAALGEPLSISAIGQPLRVELPLLGHELTDAAQCFRLVPIKASDGLPSVKNAHLEVVMQGKSGRVVVTHHEAVFEPVLRLSIEETCDARLRHDYTLLLAFPSAAAAQEPSAPLTSNLPPQQTETVKPSRRETARTPSAAAPEGRRQKSAPRPAAAPTASEAAPSAAERATPAPAREGDRLFLGGGVGDPGEGGLRLSRHLDSLARLGQITDQEREQLRREQAVLMEIDRTIVAQMELTDRIRRLEEIQASMMAHETGGAAPPLTPAPGPAPASTPAASEWIIPTAALIGLSATLAGGLLWMRRRRTTIVPGFEADDERDAEPYIPSPPYRAEAPADIEASADATGLPEIDLSAERPREPERAPLGWETASSSTPEPAGGAAAPILPIETIDEAAEEHESAIELAEIMMGFGRIQGAAETLAEFIASNPKRAVTPWLKLLEVYRAADLRQEFDALAQQLNKTFNVKAVTWDTFEEARQSRHSIEQMGHIASKVQRIWGSVECQAYLEKLLRDNRDGKREGFPLSVIDEILVLADVLEEQLGPYRPEATDVEASDQWESDGRHSQDAA